MKACKDCEDLCLTGGSKSYVLLSVGGLHLTIDGEVAVPKVFLPYLIRSGHRSPVWHEFRHLT